MRSSTACSKAAGEIYIDGEVVALKAGDWFVVRPEGHRALHALDTGMTFICIQTKTGSLEGFTMTDGVVCEGEKAPWPQVTRQLLRKRRTPARKKFSADIRLFFFLLVLFLYQPPGLFHRLFFCAKTTMRAIFSKKDFRMDLLTSKPLRTFVFNGGFDL